MQTPLQMMPSEEMKAPAAVALTDQRMILLAYLGCIAAAAGMFFLVAEQEFSSVLTMSNFAQGCSLLVMLLHIRTGQSVAGISGRSMLMLAVALALRLSSTLFLDGYLPLDKSGDMVYQVADTCSLLLVLKVLHCVYKVHRDTYDADHDALSRTWSMLGGCVLLAVAVHPSLNDWTPFDITWAASLYIETMALVPQLFLCSRAGLVPSYTAHFLALSVVSRCLSAWFWCYGAENIASMQEVSFIRCAPAVAILVAHAAQFGLLLAFGIYYGEARCSGAVGKRLAVYGDHVQLYEV